MNTPSNELPTTVPRSEWRPSRIFTCSAFPLQKSHVKKVQPHGALLGIGRSKPSRAACACSTQRTNTSGAHLRKNGARSKGGTRRTLTVRGTSKPFTSRDLKVNGPTDSTQMLSSLLLVRSRNRCSSIDATLRSRISSRPLSRRNGLRARQN